MTPIFTGFTAVLKDPDARVIAKPWLIDVDGLDDDALTVADADALLSVQDSDLLPYVDGLELAENDFDLVDVPVQSFDRMTTLGDDGFLIGLIHDLDVQAGLALVDKFVELPEVLPGVDELDPGVIDLELANQPVHRFDHMLTLDDDGFLLHLSEDRDARVGLVAAGEATEAPPVMPALGDDDFLVSADSDLPLVLPGIDDLDPAVVGFELADLPVQRLDHMMTLDDDGFLLGPTDDLGRLHENDGWLF